MNNKSQITQLKLIYIFWLSSAAGHCTWSYKTFTAQTALIGEKSIIYLAKFAICLPEPKEEFHPKDKTTSKPNNRFRLFPSI